MLVRHSESQVVRVTKRSDAIQITWRPMPEVVAWPPVICAVGLL